MPPRSPNCRWIIVVFLIGLGYALGLQQFMRPFSPDGVHFHPWSSEDMMQTVSLGELRRHPLQSLMNIHIQPPAFDAVRGVLVIFWPRLDDTAALQKVDLALYVFGSVLLGILVTLVFAWLWARAGPAAAAVGAMLVMLHPASIMFATFLDSTLLSAVLFLCTYYLLWRIKTRMPTSILLFSAAVLALFFTRSIFQWPALILLALCLGLVGASKRRILAYAVVAGLISMLYLGKQYREFRIFSTSSLSGVSLANSIGVGMGTVNYASHLKTPVANSRVDSRMPAVLTSPTKLGGRPNFNHIDYLALNLQLGNRFLQSFKHASIADLVLNYSENAYLYFRPTSTYSSGHVIVERLPWRPALDVIFSAPILPVLLVLAFARWGLRAIRGHRVRSSLGLLLPGLFVLAVSIVGDKGENMRFKYFVEPVMVVFLMSELFTLFGRPNRAQAAGPSALPGASNT